MSMTNEAEGLLLLLLFENIAWANVGDASGLQPSGAAGSLYISLHTADPGETGIQTTSEAAYTGYGRVAVARSAGGWTKSGTAPTQVANAALITFGLDTVGTETETFFGVGTAASGAGHLIYSGALTAGLIVSPGVTPQFAIGALVVTQD